MRKIIVLSFISLDGVMQAPGGPEEDPTEGFRYGGWTFPYFDDFAGREMIDQIDRPFDLLLGRKTYEIFSAYWPLQDTSQNIIAERFENAKKYVFSNTMKTADWKDSYILSGNPGEEIRKLKNTSGHDLQVHGSGKLFQALLQYDLVDELWLKIFPVVLGSGSGLFEKGPFAGSFELIESKTSPSGVIFANYRRLGDIKTGTIGE